MKTHVRYEKSVVLGTYTMSNLLLEETEKVHRPSCTLSDTKVMQHFASFKVKFDSL